MVSISAPQFKISIVTGLGAVAEHLLSRLQPNKLELLWIILYLRMGENNLFYDQNTSGAFIIGLHECRQIYYLSKDTITWQIDGPRMGFFWII